MTPEQGAMLLATLILVAGGLILTTLGIMEILSYQRKILEKLK